MIYLLDTDLLIYLVRGLKTASRGRNGRKAATLLDRCRATQAAGHSVGLSAITVSELESGAFNSRDYEEEIAAVRKILTPFDLFDFDAVTCPEYYGRVRHGLEAKGRSIGSMDTLIAAHVLALSGSLVTNNEAHFARIDGLKLANWLRKD